MGRPSFRSFVIAELALAGLAALPWLSRSPASYLDFSLLVAALWLGLLVAGVIVHRWRAFWMVPLAPVVLILPVAWGLLLYACAAGPCDL